MKLHVLSDLHLEHDGFTPPAVDADVTVLAGDIDLGARGVAWAREQWDGRPVLYVAGNHEYYGHALPALDDELRARADGSTVSVLENGERVLAGVRFLGCTLWSDFAFAGAGQRERSMSLCGRLVNDYGRVRFSREDRALRPPDTLAVHEASRRWLAERLDEPFDGPTVVITHHQPLIRSRPAVPLLQAIAGAFASDVTALMGGDRVALWIYGHTHRQADLDVRGTRVLSNPRGYPHEPVAGFAPALVVEL